MPTSVRALAERNEELETGLTRAKGTVRAGRERIQSSVHALKLFGVRAVTIGGAVWHASGEKPKTSLWGINLYSGLGILAYAAGMGRKLMGKGGDTTDMVMAVGEGLMLARVPFKVLNFRLRGMAATKKATRAKDVLTRLGADDVETEAERLDHKPSAAEAVLDQAVGSLGGQDPEIAELAEHIAGQ